MNNFSSTPFTYLKITIPLKLLLSLLTPAIVIFVILYNPGNDWDLSYGQTWLSFAIIFMLLLHSLSLLTGSLLLIRLAKLYWIYLILSALITIISLWLAITGLPALFLYPIDYHYYKFISFFNDNTDTLVLISVFIAVSMLLFIELNYYLRNFQHRKKILFAPLIFLLLYSIFFVTSNFWNSERQISKFLTGKDYNFVMDRISPDIVRKFPTDAVFALHRAIEDGDKNSVNKLLDNGTDINGFYSNYDATTPLGKAILYENVELMELLLIRGASPNHGLWEYDRNSKQLTNHKNPWALAQKQNAAFREKALILLQQYGAFETN